MSVSRLIVAGVALIALSGSAEASTAAGDLCGLGREYQVISVVADRTTIDTGGFAPDYARLRGAEIRVAAEPGLTREWLERKLESQIATGQCQFGVADADVDVVSADGSFIVRVGSTDERAAKDILRRARELTR
jgi:hypothetical protein